MPSLETPLPSPTELLHSARMRAEIAESLLDEHPSSALHACHLAVRYAIRAVLADHGGPSVPEAELRRRFDDLVDAGAGGGAAQALRRIDREVEALRLRAAAGTSPASLEETARAVRMARDVVTAAERLMRGRHT